jgi:hypothetical protein
MKEYKHLSFEERQQMTFDWRYRGWTVLELLTEQEVDEVITELVRLI